VTAANVCDELVAQWDGGPTSKRYVVGGAILSTEDKADVMRKFLDAMIGTCEKVNGKWYIRAGKYNPPSMTLTEADWLQPLSISANRSARESFNEGRPILASPEAEWQESDVEGVRGETKQDISSIDAANDRMAQPTTQLEDGYRVRFDVWTGSGFDDPSLMSAIGLSRETYYYVVNADSSYFQVATTEGGTPVALSNLPTGTLVSFYDRFLTLDGKRTTRDFRYHLVNDVTRARRLTFAKLKLARNEIRMSAVATLRAFDLLVGDTVQVIDSERGFFAKINNEIDVNMDASGTVTETAHGRSDGDPMLMTAGTDAGLREDIVYYVANATTDTYQLARYPGLSWTVVPDDAALISMHPVEGKLFMVTSWSCNNGPQGITVGLTLQDLNDDDWDWDSGYVTEPSARESVNVLRPRSVSAPTGLTVESGTSQLYKQKDGTIIVRAYLTWTGSGTAMVSVGGQYEVQYKRSSDSTWRTAAFVDGSVTSAYVTDVEDGIDYDFRVRAISSLGYQTAWDTVTNHTVEGKFAAPSAPTGVTATTSASSRYIDIEWDESSEVDVQAYLVERSDDGGTVWRPIGSTARGNTDFRDFDVAPSETPFTTASVKTYQYRIRALDTSGFISAASSSATGSCADVGPLSGLSASYDSTAEEVTVTWTLPGFDYSHVALSLTDESVYDWTHNAGRGVDTYVNDSFRSGAGLIEVRAVIYLEDGTYGTYAQTTVTA